MLESVASGRYAVTMPKPHAPEVERLARQGAKLTAEMARSAERNETLARRRAQVWADALAAGATHRLLANAAGLHPSQILKAVYRYQSNGEHA